MDGVFGTHSVHEQQQDRAVRMGADPARCHLHHGAVRGFDGVQALQQPTEDVRDACALQGIQRRSARRWHAVHMHEVRHATRLPKPTPDRRK
ncbi:hypothetical protein GCM10023205_68780 [Yinghuangia aomiensis]|uniref:Uncharacterized protein n=1 Tax=Yinghuangia aomiensis TaxID=676205 RepID=A0ABP9I4K5_9ACTN